MENEFRSKCKFMDYKILQGLVVPSGSFGFCFTDLLLVFAFVIFLCLLLSILGTGVGNKHSPRRPGVL